ncbi:DUF1801 domain-containing protein [Pontivivens insulae]|uniref:YdhG-like domain-containing protein n=1 Tax=Pontivivens insulae TaxID=1639689 RepID=A0A2R8AF11_9RHOB|nr:DUF1801 domain-containing protein [Pontivivens insulae]RED12021.1 hypothetical protein DFR53_2734 [Pontivivens insulae]SPF30777.1 hypothetical protein POI8812_03120 [Pontivivens insulae]
MSDAKTVETDADPRAFVEGVSPSVRAADGLVLLDKFQEWTGWPPRMWGDSIVGFGKYEYNYASGRSGVWPRTGFSPRKANLSIYLMPGVKKYANQLAALGPHKHSVSCLYVTRLARIDLDVLGSIVRASLADMDTIYGPQR